MGLSWGHQYLGEAIGELLEPYFSSFFPMFGIGVVIRVLLDLLLVNAKHKLVAV
jgi:hypothetical protein